MTRAQRIVLGTVFAPVVLAFAACGGADGGAAGPSGGEIAFTVNDTGWNEIWLMAADGSERRRLTEVEPPENDAAGNMSPAWSPDGTQIAFAGQVGTREEDQRLTEIYVMRADGTDRRRLTANEAFDGSPIWSPDGERIAFARVTDLGMPSARSGIVVMDADGRNEMQITRAVLPSYDLAPAWSPDGSSIAFTRVAASTSSGGSSAATFVVSPEGGEPRRLTDEGGEPHWSPDGSRITFTAFRDRFGRTCFHECSTSGEIYVLEVESGEEKRLTRTKADDGSPAWSADGSLIAFSSDRSNPQAHEYELYVMTASGENVRRLTTNDVWDREPTWRP